MNRVIMAGFLPLLMAVCGCALFGSRQCVLHDIMLEHKSFTNSYGNVWIKFKDLGMDYGHVGYEEPEFELVHVTCEGGKCVFRDMQMPNGIGLYSIIRTRSKMTFERVDDKNLFPKQDFKLK